LRGNIAFGIDFASQVFTQRLGNGIGDIAFNSFKKLGAAS